MSPRPSYTPVPGSDELRTAARGDSPARTVEKASPSSLARVTVSTSMGPMVVGAVPVAGSAVPLLVEVTDRLGPLMSPEAFCAYVQLYRLAFKDGKNVCRVSRAELTRRTRLQDRRLGKALAELVSLGAVHLVDRTRDGTLYRVSTPGEALDGEPVVGGGSKSASPGPKPPSQAPSTTASAAVAKSPPSKASSAAVAKSPAAKSPAAKSPKLVPSSSTPSSSSSTSSSVSGPPRSIGAVCQWFADTHGGGPGRSGSDVAAAVMQLLEEGQTFAVIPQLLTRFVSRAPSSAPLRDLERFLALD